MIGAASSDPRASLAVLIDALAGSGEALLHHAGQHGAVRVVGRGLNRWSNVHIDDVALLYALARTKHPPARSTSSRMAKPRG